MEHWESRWHYSVNVQNRCTKFLRYATGMLLATSLLSVEFIQNEQHKPSESNKIAALIPTTSLSAANMSKQVIPHLENVPITTPTSLVSTTETTIPYIAFTPTTTIAVARMDRENNHSGSRTSAQSMSREERCQQAVENAKVKPAPNYFIVCGPEWAYNTLEDGGICPIYNPEEDTPPVYECDGGMKPGEIRIHPDDLDTDEEWVNTVEHENGHSICFQKGDYSEWCAERMAQAH